MEETTQTVASAPAAPPGGAGAKQRKLLIIGGIALAVFALAFISLGYKNMMLRDSFGGAKVVVAGTEKDGLYSFGLLGFTQEKVKVQGTVIDYARNSGHEAVIVDDKGIHLVYVLGAETLGVGTALHEKRSLAISPDGAWVAYAERARDSETWNLIAVEVSTGDVVEFGAGVAPSFITRDGKAHLVFASADGITVADPASSMSFTTPFPTILEEGSIAISSDGARFAAKDPATGAFNLFTVDSIEPYFMLTLGEQLQGTAGSVVFAGNKALALTGASVRSFDPGAPVEESPFYTFKDAAGTYRLIP